MTTLTRKRLFQGWYSSQTATSSSAAIIQDAYEEAKAYFLWELTHDECQRIWLSGQQSLEDVQRALQDARLKYESKSTSKARKWLQMFSSRVTHYGAIFDVLVQHHPEYVSLTWGAMKFLFIAVVSHEDMTKQLAKACSMIADQLLRTDLTLIMYPTDPMKDAVAQLYAGIIRFVQHAVRWYKQGKIAHAWSAVAKPWALDFQDYADAIRDQARRIDQLANSAARAELRDAHLEMIETRAELVEARREITQLSTMVKMETQKLIQMGLRNQSLQAEMKLEISESKSIICNIQLAQILSFSAFEILPTSGDCLRYCHSVQQRRRDRTRTLLPDNDQLQAWASHPRSMLLVAQSTSSSAANDFLVGLVNVIRTSQYPVLWALRFDNYWNRNITSTDLLRMLVMQALQLNPRALTDDTYPVTMVHLREAADEGDWLRILNRALNGIPQVYLVLDSDLVGHVTSQNRMTATKLLENLCTHITFTALKVVVSSLSIDEMYISRNWDSDVWRKLRSSVLHDRSARTIRRRKIKASSRERMRLGGHS